MSHGLTGTYSTTLIKNMGFSSKRAALLNMPMGVVGIITNLGVGFGVRHTSNRWAWAVAVTIRMYAVVRTSILLTSLAGTIGASLLSFLKQPNLPGSLAGLYMITAINCITTITQVRNPCSANMTELTSHSNGLWPMFPAQPNER
jgi:hypothetical protein